VSSPFLSTPKYQAASGEDDYRAQICWNRDDAASLDDDMSIFRLRYIRRRWHHDSGMHQTSDSNDGENNASER